MEVETIIFNENGRNRKGEKVSCKNCGEIFVRRVKPVKGKKKKECCSVFCVYEYKKKQRIKVNCRNCNKDLAITKSKFEHSKHKIFFCCRQCKDDGQKIGGTCPEIQPDHYGTSTNNYRKIYKNYTDESLECYRCGYNEFESAVEIHHIDKNRNNNNIKNLIPLCANCHKAVTIDVLNIKEIIFVKNIINN